MLGMPSRPLQNTIYHVALVLDASPSMDHLVDTVIKVADDQIKFLAEQSKAMDQETRVTVYMFANRGEIHCLFYDVDVLRLPSLKEHYRTFGTHTALIDATIKSQEDLEKTATIYGDHAFLTFVLTDGGDNQSAKSPLQLKQIIDAQGDNRTVAVLVPGINEKLICERWAQKGNVAIWDATSKRGVEEAGQVIRAATSNYMSNYAAGNPTKSGVFDMSAAAVNYKTVKQLAEVTKLEVLPVKAAMDITTFITKEHGRTFKQGCYFFPLVKREKVGPQKKVVIRHKISGKVFGGPEVRDLLGLPDHEVSIKPGINPEYDIFVQSTSTNRNLVPNHDLLVIE